MLFRSAYRSSMMAISLWCLHSFSYAELYINPIGEIPQGSVSINALFTPASTITYDFGVDVDIERQYAGFSAAFGLFNQLDVFAAVSPVFDIQNGDFEGDAFNYAFGSRYSFNIFGFDLHGFTQFSNISEEYVFVETGEAASDITGVELLSALNVKFDFGRASVYGGAEFILLSDFEVDASGQDFERANKLGLHAGGGYRLNRMLMIFADINLNSEESVTFGLETKL